MIPAITEVNFPSYATLHQATVSLQEMGDRIITTQVKIDGDVVPDFSGWELVFKGERFILPVREPQAAKDNSSRNSLVDLTFESWAVNQLKRFFFSTLSEVETGVAIPDKYEASVNLSVESFVNLFNKVLKYYFGDAIRMDLFGAGTGIYSTEPVAVEISKTYIWDVLVKFYELFNVRWVIEYDSQTSAYVIKVGYTAEAITDHDFEYGYQGGLLRFERQVQDPTINNVLLGRGGENNLPYRYFKLTDEDNPTWQEDPDAIPELANVYFDRLRDANFRWYVRGWMQNENRNHSWDETHSFPTYTENDCPEPYLFAFRKGKTDEKFNPVEYVKDDASIAKYGERWGAVEDNDDVYPTIKGVTRPNLGRVDEVIAVSPIITDDINTAAKAEAQENEINGTKVVTRTLAPQETKVDHLQSETFTIPTGCTGNIEHVNCNPYSGRSGRSGGTSVVILDTTAFNIKAVSVTTGQEYAPEGLLPGTYYLKYTFSAHNNSTTATFKDMTYGFSSLTLTISSDNAHQWTPKFDIWVKNIWETEQGADETDEQYAARVWTPILGDRAGKEAAVMFSDGFMSISDDYEFVIAGYPVKDRSKVITRDGVTYTSEWRIPLYKSDAEFEATGKYLPNTETGGTPIAGDHFYFIGVDMPFNYVVWAEEALNGSTFTPAINKAAGLLDFSEISPSWLVSLDKVRCNTHEGAEYGQHLADRLAAGATVRIKDKRFTNNEVLTLYVQSITYTWSEASEGNPYLVPDIEVTLSDKPVSAEGTVTRVSNELNVVKATYAKSADIEATVRKVGSALFLKKTGESDTSVSPTSFASSVKSDDFKQGDFGGAGWGHYRDTDDNSILEVDKLVIRKELRVNSLVGNQIAYVGGKKVTSAAAIECTQVVEGDTHYTCYFDQKQGSVANLFAVNDIAMGQEFDETNAETRYYRMVVTAVGPDYIKLQKSGKDGAGEPVKGDVIIQYGSTSNTNRQYVIVEDVIGGGYVRMISGLNATNANGKEYLFAGRIGQQNPRAFLGDTAGEYAEWADGALNIKGRITVRDANGDYQAMDTYMAGVASALNGLETSVDGLAYLKAATNQGTLVQGGLVLTSMMQLGYTSEGVYNVMSGINGIKDSTLSDPSKSIAAWYGGPMVDHEASPSAASYAKSLFRFDGSGYLAGGYITWNQNGAGSIPGVSWENNQVVINGNVKLASTSGDSVTELLEFVRVLNNMFQDEEYQVNGVTKHRIRVRSAFEGLYTEGFLSAGGLNMDSGGGASGIDLDRMWASLKNTVADTHASDKIAEAHIPTTIVNKASHGETAYGWGNHANAGYLTAVPLATSSAIGGIKIGYTNTGKNYAVQLSDGKAYVYVPWTDTTYGNATTSAAGLMSAADKTILNNIYAIVPNDAYNAGNELADKNYVDTNIATATATYQGSYNSVSDLSLSASATRAQIATALGTTISGADENDYCFVEIPTSASTATEIARVERYKYNGTAWAYEYTLNNSGLTSAQWAALNSGITSALVTTFNGKYAKPSTGIPKTDLATAVQTSLGLADTALQSADLDGYVNEIATGSGNYISGVSKSGKKLTFTYGTLPTALKNPTALTFGSKTYDGSEAKTITASDLGALTSHQTIYALTIKNSAGTTQVTYAPNSAASSLTLTNAMVGLGNVENTALSTWAGTSNITTVGTLASGAVPLSLVTGADDLKAIEALTGTSGLLKKTAANTWALDTNTYIPTQGISQTLTEQRFTFRKCPQTIGANGLTLKSIKGLSLTWNQLIQNPDFSDGTNHFSTLRCSLSINDSVLSVTPDGTGNPFVYQDGVFALNKTHKYLYIARVMPSVGMSFLFSNFLHDYGSMWCNANEWTTLYKIIEINAENSNGTRACIASNNRNDTFEVDYFNVIDLTVMYGAGYEPATVAEFESLYNKPYYPCNTGEIINNKTTALKVVGFNKWDDEYEDGRYDVTTGDDSAHSSFHRSKHMLRVLPNTAYYANQYSGTGSDVWMFFYDAGMNLITGLSGVGRGNVENAHNVNNYVFTTPSNCYYVKFYLKIDSSVCINISDVSKNGTYEPYKETILTINIPTLTGKLNGEGESVVLCADGAKSAGTVYDGFIVENGYITKFVKRVGTVDLGTLSWRTWTFSNNPGFMVGLRGGVGVTGVDGKGNAVCAKYIVVNNNGVANEGADKVLAYGAFWNIGSNIYIVDSAYTDAATFKTAMSGVMLNYELATPEVYVLDTPIPTKMVAGTTEQRLPEDASNSVSAPFRADITYSVDSSEPMMATEYALTAGMLLNSRKLWGRDFDGSADVSGDMSGVGNISFASTGKNIASLLYFDTNNARVGVNTVAPAYRFDVSGSLNATTIYENGTSLSSLLDAKSAVTLNGTSAAGTTASFYAPTTSGTTGQLLKATTSGAPVWTSAGLGWNNKPIYLDANGVLTEGFECLRIDYWNAKTEGTALLNAINLAGVYRVQAQTDVPDNKSYGNLMVLRGPGQDTLAQMYFPYYGDDFYARFGSVNDLASLTWKKVWNSGNAGAGHAWACSTLTTSSYATINGDVYGVDNLYAQQLISEWERGLWLDQGGDNMIWGHTDEDQGYDEIRFDFICPSHFSDGLYSDSFVTAGAAAASSDKRLKDNITAVSTDRALSVLSQLKPSEWVWNGANKHLEGKRGAGLIAQDVEKVLPFAVINEGKYLALNYNVLHAYEIAGIQNLEERVKKLEQENRELKEKISILAKS